MLRRCYAARVSADRRKVGCRVRRACTGANEDEGTAAPPVETRRPGSACPALSARPGGAECCRDGVAHDAARGRLGAVRARRGAL